MVNENSAAVEPKPSPRTKHEKGNHIEISPTIDEARTYITSQIGPARSSPSPSVTHRHKTTHVRALPDASPIIVPEKPGKTHSRDSRQSNQRASNDVIPTVIFSENNIRDNDQEIEETYF